MKWLFRAFLLWFVLGALAWMLGTATSQDLVSQTTLAAAPNQNMTRPLADLGWFLLLPLAVWLTAKVAAELPGRWLLRAGFWTVTLAGWFALLVVAQGSVESHADQRWNFFFAVGLAGLIAIGLAVKARAWPTWRGVRDTMAGVAILALTIATLEWRYDAQTHALVSRAEARWTEIGLPMAEFEKTLTPERENAGSEVFRQVLRERVSSRFYKDGTRAAEHEPAIEGSSALREGIKQATNVAWTTLPPSDDIDPSFKSFAAVEPMAPALEADYRRILAKPPPVWATDPRDGYFMSVPNFLGIRMFSQLTAADAMRRLSVGDQEGAARALAAGQRLHEDLRHNPSLVSLLIDVSEDALFAPEKVRLPASENGLKSVADDVASFRAEFLRRLQIEGWLCLRFADRMTDDQTAGEGAGSFLPKWARRIVNRPLTRRWCAVGLLDEAEHAAIHQSPATLSLPDLGMNLHEAVAAVHPSFVDVAAARASMRIYATLLLREQVELIRGARAILAAGHAVESRDSVVLPGVRWELSVGAGKDAVATRLVGAPEWIVKRYVTPDTFWVLPIDGSVAWKFHLPAQTASR